MKKKKAKKAFYLSYRERQSISEALGFVVATHDEEGPQWRKDLTLMTKWDTLLHFPNRVKITKANR